MTPAQTPTAAILTNVDAAVVEGPLRAELEVAGALHRARAGTRTASSASSSTGASTRCRRSATSGIRATCTRRARRSSSITWPPSARSRSSATRTSSRSSRPSSSIPQQWAALFKEAGAQLRGAGRRAPRRLPDVRLLAHRLERREDGAQARLIGELAKAVRAQGIVFGVSSHRAEHWWFFDQRQAVRFRRPRSEATPRSTGPRVEPDDVGEGQTRARPGVPRRLAGAHRRARGQVPAAARLVRLVDRAARVQSAPAAASRPSTTTAARSGDKGVAINYKKHGGESFPDTAAVLDIERGQLAASARTSGRPTRRSRRTPGATSRIRTTRRPTRSWTTSWTSSARTAACC